MEWEPEPGMHIGTLFGPATIDRVIRDGILVHLNSGSMKGQVIRVPNAKMGKIITDHPTASKSSVLPSLGRPLKKSLETTEDTIVSYKKCVNALRFGLVPHEFINKLTLGYGNLEQWVFSSFPQQDAEKPQVVHRIIGQYGEGKSHTMSAIRHIAYEEGYLVARVEVDGKSVTLADPKSILYHLMNSVSGKNLNKSMPLLDIYQKAMTNGYDASDLGHPEMDRIPAIFQLIKHLRQCGCLSDVDYVLYDILTSSDDLTTAEAKKQISTICGSKVSMVYVNVLHPMIGHTVIERPDNFFECLVGTTRIAQMAGYKGLIITIDEYEVEETLMSGRSQIEKAASMLSGMIEYFSGETYHKNAPIAIYFASVPSSEDSCNNALIDAIVNSSRGETYNLEPYGGWDPQNREQLELVQRIHDIYTQAYSCQQCPIEEIIEKLDGFADDYAYESGGIRSFMKRYINLLDSLYGPPSLSS